MSQEPIDLAIALKAEIDARSYLPVWLKDGIAGLVNAMQAGGGGAGAWADRTGTALNAVRYPPVNTQDLTAFWSPPFPARAIEVFVGGTIDLETHDGIRLQLNVPVDWYRPLAVRKIYRAGTTASNIILYK